MAELDMNDQGNQFAAGVVGGSAVTAIGSTAAGGTVVGSTVTTGLTSLANAGAAPAAVKLGFATALKVASFINPITAAAVIGGGAALFLISRIKK